MELRQPAKVMSTLGFSLSRPTPRLVLSIFGTAIIIGVLNKLKDIHVETVQSKNATDALHTSELRGSRRSWSSLARASGFSANQSGAIVISFALLLPVLLFAVGLAVDATAISTQKSDLQEIADIGALAGAKELSFSNAKEENVAAVVRAKVEQFVQAQKPTFARKTLDIETKITNDPLQVTVSLSTKPTRFFENVFSANLNLIATRSKAEIVGRPNICVLALAHYGLGGAVWLTKRARLTGVDCSVFSNSTLPGGIVVRDRAILKASVICSAGGFEGGQGHYEPAPYADCPRFDDPLADRVEPVSAGCTFSDTRIFDQTVSLVPGTYCGGLEVSGSSRVRLEPGTYIIKDGPLVVTDTAELTGHGVGFFMTGAKSGVDFDVDTTISLTAAEKGTMAGMLFFGSRSQSVLILNRIRSNNARQLLGTIYFPKSNLQVDADQPVGDQSAWTAIVVNRLLLMEGPHLVLNTNYDHTDVPVPNGIRGAGQPVTLVE